MHVVYSWRGVAMQRGNTMMRRLTQSRARVFLLVVLAIGFVAALALVAGAALQPASKSDGAGVTSGESSLAAQGKPAVLPAATVAAGYAVGAPAPSAGSDAASRNARTAAGGAAQPAAAAQSNINVPDPNAQKQIIKTGMLSLVVKDEDIDAGMAQVRSIAAQYKGDVLNANVTKSGDLRVADVVIQVPSDQF